jgi:hypothetical protein
MKGGWMRAASSLLLAGCATASPRRPADFEGRVVDDLGDPVPEASIEILGPPVEDEFGISYAVLGRATSSPDGTFSMRGVPPGPCLVEVTAAERAPVQRLPVIAPCRDAKLVCPRWGRIAFRLTPPPGEASPERADLCYTYDGRQESECWSGWGTAGAFEGGGFAPGPMAVTIVARGWAPIPVTFSAEPGSTVDLGEIPIHRGHAVIGCVVDRQGKPLARAWVYAQPTWTSDYDTYADAEGRFRIDHLPPEALWLWASADGYVSQRVPVRWPADAGETRISLARGGILRVSIRTKDDGVPYSCWIRVVYLDDPDPFLGDVHGQVSCGGEFDLSLPAGRYRVDHLRSGAGPVASSREVTLEVAGERSVEFVEDWE